MSQSRAERRRNDRTGATPPRRRDPMVPIYIGLAVVVVLIFAGFGIANWIENSHRQSVAAQEFATPTPLPSGMSKGKPIQLQDLKPIGKATGFPQPDVSRNVLPDTAQGGKGQTVDGIPCEATEQIALHVHSHLAIFVNGVQVQVPGFLGMAATASGGCLYWLHTHGPDGIIHIEAGDAESPQGGPYTLGDFFDIWGETLTRSQIGPFKGDVTAFLNGAPYNGDLRAIPLVSHQIITLEVGRPVVPPPNYLLPKGD